MKKSRSSITAGVFASEIIYQGLSALQYKGIQFSFWESCLEPCMVRRTQNNIINVIILHALSENKMRNIFYEIVNRYYTLPILLLLSQPIFNIYDILRKRKGPLGIASVDDPLNTIANGIQTIVLEQKDWFSQHLPVVNTVDKKCLALEPSDYLTEREIDVLQLLSHGMTNKEIAYRLSISERTVRFHLKNIYQKLGCAGRGETIALINKVGIFEFTAKTHRR